MIIINKINKEGGYRCRGERDDILHRVVRDGFTENVALGQGLKKTKW